MAVFQCKPVLMNTHCPLWDELLLEFFLLFEGFFLSSYALKWLPTSIDSSLLCPLNICQRRKNWTIFYWIELFPYKKQLSFRVKIVHQFLRSSSKSWRLLALLLPSNWSDINWLSGLVLFDDFSKELTSDKVSDEGMTPSDCRSAKTCRALFLSLAWTQPRIRCLYTSSRLTSERTFVTETILSKFAMSLSLMKTAALARIFFSQIMDGNWVSWINRVACSIWDSRPHFMKAKARSAVTCSSGLTDFPDSMILWRSSWRPVSMQDFMSWPIQGICLWVLTMFWNSSRAEFKSLFNKWTLILGPSILFVGLSPRNCRHRLRTWSTIEGSLVTSAASLTHLTMSNSWFLIAVGRVFFSTKDALCSFLPGLLSSSVRTSMASVILPDLRKIFAMSITIKSYITNGDLICCLISWADLKSPTLA